ncbi:sentrin-specific protease 8 [Thecamonas trahens ATCC 50062]|uniref:Sentrin-specific protease 8 n=1 Tax=Thecamonas trahens ATCC 50062 TaxID=461836 RepID=A0A0L0D1C6_THETB|nr:sentrin-specific protease 8 [Thecamonas trahens ATCC 50062]KNC45930.1 sentrin-specific protease 8 [Thecamonas trahens ATCC 50062]|eukprot:XP_013762913.1 sentrin-specific protease 8 [Thecamonas trahens ATCC 50062]
MAAEKKQSGRVGLCTLGGTTLLQSELELLDDGAWLNDNIISFYFEYLVRDVVAGGDGDGDGDGDGLPVVFLPPATVFLMTAVPDPSMLAPSFEPLGLGKAKQIVIAVNDKTSLTDHIGGSHWSLLVYSAEDRTYRHYDSAGGCNAAAAADIAAVVDFFVTYNADPPVSNEASFVADRNTPQQRNGYDCGVYLLHFAHCIAAGEPVTARPDRLVAMRLHVRSVIDAIAAEQRE